MAKNIHEWFYNQSSSWRKFSINQFEGKFFPFNFITSSLQRLTKAAIIHFVLPLTKISIIQIIPN